MQNVQKIWGPSPPIDEADNGYARAGMRGTWQENEKGESERVPPLQMVWQPGSTDVADFTWPGMRSDIAVRAEVGVEIARKFSGFELNEIEYCPLAKRDQRKRNTLQHPYSGPPQKELWVNCWVHMDVKRPGVNVIFEEEKKWLGLFEHSEHFLLSPADRVLQTQSGTFMPMPLR